MEEQDKGAIKIPKTNDSSKTETTAKTAAKVTTTSKKTTTTAAETAPPETTTETTTVTTTAPEITEQDVTESINEGDESYAQTGVSQTTAAFPQTSYSGHIETAPYEGGYTSEEDTSETVSSQADQTSAAETVSTARCLLSRSSLLLL